LALAVQQFCQLVHRDITFYKRGDIMAGTLRCALSFILILAVSGCISLPRSTCATVGGLLGAGSGVVVANNETEDETDENLAAGAIGAVSGALLGALVCTGDRIPPRAAAAATPPAGEPPLPVRLSAQGSTDEDGKIVSYVWDFGDGTRGEGAQTSHTYQRPGRYAARVTVTDDDGLTSSATATVDLAEQVSAAPPTPAPRRIVLQGITFPFDSAKISDADAPVLDLAAEQLNANPSVRARVVGHTDSTGDEAYNQKLSERRAESVVEYLAKAGVESSRLEASGAGESEPVASNDTKDGRAQNRRVELNVNE
jgi:OOP family OmpA-OmpF porin